jgi:hypothetical protein
MRANITLQDEMEREERKQRNIAQLEYAQTLKNELEKRPAAEEE